MVTGALVNQPEPQPAPLHCAVVIGGLVFDVSWKSIVDAPPAELVAVTVSVPLAPAGAVYEYVRVAPEPLGAQLPPTARKPKEKFGSSSVAFAVTSTCPALLGSK